MSLMMTLPQILICVATAGVGLALIVHGVRSWASHRARAQALPHGVLTGIAPAAILFGVMFLLIATNFVVVITSNYENSLRWWPRPPGGGAIDGMLADPSITFFVLGACAAFWWPRDAKRVREFVARKLFGRTPEL